MHHCKRGRAGLKPGPPITRWNDLSQSFTIAETVWMPALTLVPTEPRLVATIGLHSSASTWIFNIVRELLIACHGEDQVVTGYADDLARLPTGAGAWRLIKSHSGSDELDAWLTEHRARAVLTIRDPRDACLSMTLRFKSPLQHTVRWIASDCNRIVRLVSRGYPLFRYEDRFFDNPATVENLASLLGLAVPPAAQAVIFNRYRTDAVRAFAESVPSLPPARIQPVGTLLMDSVTQIHATHIGDTSSGKWRHQPAALQAELTRIFLPFLRRFGYQP